MSPGSNEDSHTASRRTSRQAINFPPTGGQQQEERPSEAPTGTASQGPFEHGPIPTGTDGVNRTTQDSWPDATEPTLRDGDDEFVNAVLPEYEDSNEPGSAMDLPTENSILATRLPPVLLELRWLPPRPPTSYDGFNIYVYRDGTEGGGAWGPVTSRGSYLFYSAGNVTETASVDENTHEFFTELTEPGTYQVRVTTLSSSGECEARESSPKPGFTFYRGAFTRCFLMLKIGHLCLISVVGSRKTKPLALER